MTVTPSSSLAATYTTQFSDGFSRSGGTAPSANSTSRKQRKSSGVITDQESSASVRLLTGKEWWHSRRTDSCPDRPEESGSYSNLRAPLDTSEVAVPTPPPR